MDIIIVNHNSTDAAINCINSVYRSSNGISVNVIVADNASNDEPMRLKDRFPDITLISNKKNLGFSKAINQAFLFSRSPYLLILNPDTLIFDNFFECATDYLKRNKSIGILGPKIHDSDGSIQGSARKFPNFLTSLFGRKSPITKLFPNNPITKKEFICFSTHDNKSVEVDWVSGACMVINREAFEAVGGFDERFFLYWEDTDLCYRVKKQGWKNVFYPSACVMHMVGKSSSQKPFFSTWHFHLSCYLLCKKYIRWPIKSLTPFAFLLLMMRAEFVMCIHAFNFLKNLYLKKKYRKKEIERYFDADSNGMTVLRFMGNTKNGFVIELYDQISRNMVTNRIYIKDHRPVSLRYFKAYLIIFKMLVKFKPNAIHTELTEPGFIVMTMVGIYNLFKKDKIKILHSIGKRISGDSENWRLKYFSRVIEKLLALKTDIAIADYQVRKREISKKNKIAQSEKVKVIKQGPNLANAITNDQIRNEIRKKFNIDKETILIGSVGKFVPKKNHLLLVKAAEKMIKKNPYQNIKIIFFGKVDLKKTLTQYGESRNISNHIIFNGLENDISKIYAGLDIFAHTSAYEDIPFPIIKAMASLVPVITTGVGSVTELLGKFHELDSKLNGFKLCERGILCPTDDPDIFANGIEYLVKNGLKGDRDRLIKAREFVLENYGNIGAVNDIEKAYSDILIN